MRCNAYLTARNINKFHAFHYVHIHGPDRNSMPSKVTSSLKIITQKRIYFCYWACFGIFHCGEHHLSSTKSLTSYKFSTECHLGLLNAILKSYFFCSKPKITIYESFYLSDETYFL